MRLSAARAGQCLFVSDAAEWIVQAVGKQLPGFKHIIDFYHASEHVKVCGEALYGQGRVDAGRRTRYGSHRLKPFGAGYVKTHLAGLSRRWSFDRSKNEALLKLGRYLRKHEQKMDYPTCVSSGWPIGSGPMESFCKQLGLRMKGPGMRWNLGSVTPMGMLVSRWSLDPDNCPLFGIQSKAA